MGFCLNLREDSFFRRRKIKKDLRAILKENGLERKPRTLRHPFIEKFARNNILIQLSSGIKHDYGSIEHGIGPYDYGVVSLEMSGSSDHPIFVKVERELIAYSDTH